jgi:hypothetical protein
MHVKAKQTEFKKNELTFLFKQLNKSSPGKTRNHENFSENLEM